MGSPGGRLRTKPTAGISFVNYPFGTFFKRVDKF
jgi:hypothetical protein